MPSLQAMLVVAAAGFGFSLSPGPSMLYVLSRSLGQGRAAGLASAIGLALGGVALAMVTAIGAGVLLTDSTTLFTVVRIAGGLYLLYLAVRAALSLREYRNRLECETDQNQSMLQIVRQGFMVEALNPKTVLFFAAFLPGFVDESAGGVGVQMLILGMLIPLTAIPSDVTVATAASMFSEKIRANPRFGIGLEVLGVVILFGLAVRILLAAL